MAGRGKNSPFIRQEGYDLRSRHTGTGPIGRSLENENTGGTVEDNVHRSADLNRASSVISVNKSKVSSHRTNNSHSSRIQTKEVEQNMKEQLAELEDEKLSLQLAMQSIDIEIGWLENNIILNQEHLDNNISVSDEEETESRKRNLFKYQEQLQEAYKRKQLQQAEENTRKILIERKIQIIKGRAGLEIEKIAEINDQHLGSDEELDEKQDPSIVIDDLMGIKYDRMNEFLTDATAESQRQAKLAAQNLEEVTAEKAKLDLQKLLIDQKAKLKVLEETATEDKRRQEEKLTQEKQKQMDLEYQLKKLETNKPQSAPEITGQSEQSTPAVGDARLIQIFAQAIKGSLPASNLTDSNSKFLARQSYAKELPFFSGKAEEWPIFYADFERSTKDCGFSNSENMSRLRKCLKGDAARYVQSLMVSPDNVPTLMKKLEIRYGQPELIIEAMILKAKGIPTFKEDQLNLFIEFGSAVQNVIATIQTLNLPSHLSNPQLLKELETKLPRPFMMQWLNWVVLDKSRKKDLVNFAEWIDGQTTLACQACPPSPRELEYVQDTLPQTKPDPRGKKKINSSESKKEDFPTAAGLFAGEKTNWNKKPKCIFCEKHLDSSSCSKAQDMTLQEKMEVIKAKEVCELCLRSGHWKKSCKSFIKCLVCKKRHLTLMCPLIQNTKVPIHEETKVGESDMTNADVQTASSNLACTSKVLLKTLLVPVITKFGRRTVRALLDDGSQRSYILKTLAKELDLPVIGSENLIHALFSGVNTATQRHNKYKVTLKHSIGCGYSEMEVLDQDRICGEIPRLSGGPWLRELKEKNIYISDIGGDCPEIELLIGADILGKLLTGNVKQLRNGLTAVETIIGWTLMGKTTNMKENNIAMTVTSMFVSEVPVTQLWDLEVIGIRDPIEKRTREESEELAKQHFLETVTRTEDGRFSVSLPWINGKTKIPDNKKIAERRLESTTKRLITLGKFDAYDKIFASWCQEGIIEEVTPNLLNQDCHYIPHRAVFKPESLTTPIRPVFDASCKAPRTPSLNECLEKGPNLLEMIPSIILKFREGKIGVAADIRKAFQMIEVKENDRDCLRFLWWKDYPQKIHRIYRHCRVVFGVTCSPFLLGAVLEHLLINVPDEEKRMAQKVLKSLYVDNLLTSADTLNEVMALKEWATYTLAQGKMELREWEGGTGEKSGIGSPPGGCGLDFGRTASEGIGKCITSVLGYKWNKLEDVLYCDLNHENLPDKFTKRNVLSYLQKVYDPIGFTCPFTLQPKLLLQKLWEKKIGWDEELSEEFKEEFVEWCNQLDLLRQIKIPRNVTGSNSSRENWQVHTFCDASQDAYAAVVFLRTEVENRVSVQLLMAKSRVAPLKKPTINRLELLSCFVAATITDFIKEALSLAEVPIYYWSDSSTALAWIRRNDDWGTFVGNRVKTICRLTNSEDWRHVPGVSNPADLPSRGCSSSQLLTSKWWEGPSWLKQPKEYWPSGEFEAVEAEIKLERKKTAVTLMSITTPRSDDPWYCKKSTFRRNIMTIAWLKRFVKLAKNPKESANGKVFSVDEINEAEKVLFLLLQKDTLPKDENCISGIQVNRSEDGLVRVKTKLDNRDDSENFRNPILLPFAHPAVDQIIWREHIKSKHAGAQFLMSKLRENFWIIKGRRAIRRILKKCTVCRRFDTKKSNVVPAPLPEGRVQTSRVFQTIGVDLCGPLFTKGGGKAWIVLMTCAVYRCVHLELVMSLSTDSFMDAFSRFTARRGRPATVYSDNGTNFVGAEAALKELDWEKIQLEYAVEKIQWKFNPPASPWWGGFFERMIRSVKSLLRRTLGNSKLTYEKLETCVIEIEAVINGRPLTVVTEDPDDLIPLTPAMYLHEMPYPSVTDRELLEASGFQRLLQARKNFLEEIKMRFRKEYLALLVHRGKEKPAMKFQLGDIVLLGSDDKKRWEWPMARILELLPGKDGNVRVAKVKTAKGILTRPIQWLFPMEISSPLEVLQVKEKGSSPPRKATTMEKADVKTKCGRQVKVPERFGQ